MLSRISFHVLHGSSKEAKDKVYLHSIKSKRNLKLFKNDKIKEVQDHLQHNLELQASISKAFIADAKTERDVRGNHSLQHSMLRDYVVELQSITPNTTVKIAAERNNNVSLPTRGWSGQAYKDLLRRYRSATTVMEFKRCVLELKKINLKAHE
nr:hypothetical protein [Tanacetum cinerariifolium]